MGPVIMMIIGYLLLALCIKTGIDYSKMSANLARTQETLEEIKEILKERSAIPAQAYEPGNRASAAGADDESGAGEGDEVEQCPACEAQVRARDRVCRSCGLTLRADDGDMQG